HGFVGYPFEYHVTLGFGSIAGGLDHVNFVIRLPLVHGIRRPYNSSSRSVSSFALSLTPKISTVESIKALTLTIHVKMKMKMKSLWSYSIDVAPNYNTCLPNRQTPNQITPTTRFEAATAKDS
nr:hypothetical protein [Tanacetum cinerariifolium]